MAVTIASVDPNTGELWRRFEPDSPEILERKLNWSREGFATWSNTSISDRAQMLEQAARILETEREMFARLMTREMGKPIQAARDEVTKCATTCRHYADHGQDYLEPECVTGSDEIVRFDPLGVILAVMPWNYPFWQVIRFAAPALIAGNVGLLKHASNVPSCALALEDLFCRAGAPEGTFQSLLIGSAQVPAVLEDRRIAAVTLTGSESAGRAVGALAGRQLKKSVLELGGSDPFIVLSTANLERAIPTAMRARVINNGQSCIAAKRFIVVEPLYETFVQGFVAAMKALKIGDPGEEATEIGPLATSAIRHEVDQQVRALVSAGATLLLGGAAVDGPGNFYPPTVICDVPLGVPVAREEIFGPVALVYRANDARHALELANESDFGLGASVWTQDRQEAAWFSRELQVGSVFVNAMVASDPRFPFGGIKRSGHGRELGVYGLREFLNIKTVRATF